MAGSAQAVWGLGCRGADAGCGCNVGGAGVFCVGNMVLPFPSKLSSAKILPRGSRKGGQAGKQTRKCHLYELAEKISRLENEFQDEEYDDKSRVLRKNEC